MRPTEQDKEFIDVPLELEKALDHSESMNQIEPPVNESVLGPKLIEPAVNFYQVGDIKPTDLEAVLTTASSAQEQVQKQFEDPVAELAQYVADPENKKSAYNLAKGFHDIMGNKWFTLERASVKCGMTELMTFQKLKLCELFGHAMLKKGDPMDPKQRGKLTARITIDAAMELAALDDTIKQLQAELHGLELKRKTLQGSIDYSSSKLPGN